MTAMSPGRSRPTSRLVRRSSRTVPATAPGSTPRDRRRVGRRIKTILTRARTNARTPPGRPAPTAPVSRAGPRVASGAAGSATLLPPRDGEQLLGVRDAEVGVGQPGQHPGQLPGAVGVLHHAYAAGGDRPAGVLRHHQ